MVALQLSVEVAARALDIPFRTLVVLHLFVWLATLVPIAGFVEPKLWISAFAMLGGFLLAATYPDLVWHIMAASNFVLVVNFVAAWRDQGDQEGTSGLLHRRRR